MADAKTWIDVADTAVKVGLGAFIGGGITLLLAKLDHGREERKELAKRRLDNFEIAFSEINEFSQAISLYWAKLNNALFLKTKNELNEKHLEELKIEEEVVFNKFLVLGAAKTKLELLSENDCVVGIEEFRDVAENFFKIGNINNEECTKEILSEIKEELISSRRKLMESLSKAYAPST